MQSVEFFISFLREAYRRASTLKYPRLKDYLAKKLFDISLHKQKTIFCLIS